MAERLMPENRAHHQNIKQCHKHLKNSSTSRAKLETNVTTSMMGKSFTKLFHCFDEIFVFSSRKNWKFLTVLLENFAHVTYETSLGDIAL